MTRAQRHPYPSPTVNGRDTITEAALGVDRVDIGVLAGTPRIIFEDAGFTIWEVDNSAGTLRIFTPGSVKLTVDPTGTLTVYGEVRATSYQSPDGTGPYLDATAVAGAGTVDIANRNNVANVPLRILAMAGQTADLTRWHDEAGVLAAYVDYAGHVSSKKMRASIYRNANYTIAPSAEQVIAFDLGTGTGMSASGGQVTIGAIGAEFDCNSTVKLKLENLTAAAITVKDLYAHLKLNHASGASAVILDDYHVPPFVLAAFDIVEVTMPTRRTLDLVTGNVIGVVVQHFLAAASVTVTVLGAASDATGVYKQSWLDINRRV